MMVMSCWPEYWCASVAHGDMMDEMSIKKKKKSCIQKLIFPLQRLECNYDG